MIIFGDSHVALYSGLPGIRTEHLGPITMNRLGRDGLAACGVKASLVWPYTRIGFVCGQIDVRVWFRRQRDVYGRSVDEIAERLSQTHFAAIEAFITTAGLGDLAVAIFSVIPPPSCDSSVGSTSSPCRSDEERAEGVRVLNRHLASAALRAGYAFVDQHSPFADERGFLDPRFSSDSLHVHRAHARRVDLRACFDRSASRVPVSGDVAG